MQNCKKLILKYYVEVTMYNDTIYVLSKLIMRGPGYCMDYKPLSNLFIELWVANSLLSIPLCLN